MENANGKLYVWNVSVPLAPQKDKNACFPCSITNVQLLFTEVQSMGNYFSLKYTLSSLNRLQIMQSFINTFFPPKAIQKRKCMWSKECILCIFSWLATGSPHWSECLLCLSVVIISKGIHTHLVVQPNRKERERKLHLTSASQEQGSHSLKNVVHLRHAPCWRRGFSPQPLLWALLRSDQGRRGDSKWDALLPLAKVQLSKRKALQSSMPRNHLKISYENKLRKIRRKIDKI